MLAYLHVEESHHGVLEEVLRDIRLSQGSRLLVTSTYAIVETVRIRTEFQDQALRDSAEELMDFFWNDRSIIRLVELHVGIALCARHLQRQITDAGGKLTPFFSIDLMGGIGQDHQNKWTQSYAPFASVSGACKQDRVEALFEHVHL